MGTTTCRGTLTHRDAPICRGTPVYRGTLCIGISTGSAAVTTGDCLPLVRTSQESSKQFWVLRRYLNERCVPAALITPPSFDRDPY